MSVPHLSDQEKRTLAELKVALVVLLGSRLLRLTLDEFEHLRNRERRIALDIEKEGVPL
jgi:hypothetical protein